jgi:hypothetical protein
MPLAVGATDNIIALGVKELKFCEENVAQSHSRGQRKGEEKLIT